jgi:hypothetical protein
MLLLRQSRIRSRLAVINHDTGRRFAHPWIGPIAMYQDFMASDEERPAYGCEANPLHVEEN